MRILTISDPEKLWSHVTTGMLHLPSQYNPHECPLLARVYDHMYTFHSSALLIVGNQHVLPGRHLTYLPVYLTAHCVQYDERTIIINLMLASIPKQKNESGLFSVRPWAVTELFSDWFHIQQRHGLRVLIGLSPEVDSRYPGLDLFRRTACGRGSTRYIDGIRHHCYPISRQWCDEIIEGFKRMARLPDAEYEEQKVTFLPDWNLSEVYRLLAPE